MHALLTLREPCFWREDQSDMYEATHTHTHTHTHFFLLSDTNAHKHEPLWRNHRGTKGSHDGIYKHAITISLTYLGRLIIYLRYTTCIVGPPGVLRRA